MKELKSKKLLAAFLAMVMAIGMTACGSSSDDEDEDEEEETTTTVAEEESEAEETTATTATTTTAAEESVAETESAADSTEDSTADESTADSTTEAVYADGTFTNGIYSLTVDESKWEYSETSDTDCNFAYIGETDDVYKSASTFNVVSLEGSIYAAIDPEEYADTVKGAYESVDGCTASDGESVTFAGQDAYTYNVTYAASDELTMEMVQVIFSTDDACVVVTYGAIDSVFDEMQSEFDEVFTTMTVS